MRGLGLRDESARAVQRRWVNASRKDLQRDVASKLCVAGPIDLAHPAGAEERDDVVGAETRTGGQSHRLLTRP
jgi:hypothetical protein